MQVLLPYFRLMRLPAVFSALADIFLGYLLTHPSLEPVWTFGWLLFASAGLYLAGMVFNDVFDRVIDAQERPERPLPSGKVTLRSAVTLGVVLVVLGNAAAATAGLTSLLVALLLTGCVFGYDGWLKGTPLGPVAMGACRFLNVMLGASALGAFDDLWRLPQLHVALAFGVYIAGVTWFSRHEARISRRWSLAAAMGVVNLGFALLVAFMLNVEPQPRGEPALLALAVVVITVNRRMMVALFEPVPQRVQGAVRFLLFSYLTLSAAVVLHITGSLSYTFTVLALLIPAWLLGRWMAMT